MAGDEAQIRSGLALEEALLRLRTSARRVSMAGGIDLVKVEGAIRQANKLSDWLDSLLMQVPAPPFRGR